MNDSGKNDKNEVKSNGVNPLEKETREKLSGFPVIPVMKSAENWFRFFFSFSFGG